MLQPQKGKDGTVPSALLPILLALATVASTATKLRAPNLPLGAGDFLLVSWLGASLFYRAISTGFVFQPSFALRWGAPFLLALACFLLIGSLAAQATGVTSSYSTTHETVAWIFVFVLIGWFLIESAHSAEVMRFIKWFAATGAIVVTLLLAAAIVLRVTTGNQFLWYGGIRMAGLSENPNQLAILCAPLPFLCLHFSSQSHGARRRWWQIGVFGCAAAGIATLSDALLLAWCACGATLAAYSWFGLVFGVRRSPRSMLSAALAVPALLAGFLLLAGGNVLKFLEDFAESRADDGGQASDRILLWERGLQATFDSPFFGWGPGAHSGGEAPFEGSEAHNVLIDLAAQAGIPITAALIALVAMTAIIALRKATPYLALAVCSEFLLALFHNTLRHPIFWLTIFSVLAACTGSTIRSRVLAPGRLPIGGKIQEAES